MKIKLGEEFYADSTNWTIEKTVKSGTPVVLDDAVEATNTDLAPIAGKVELPTEEPRAFLMPDKRIKVVSAPHVLILEPDADPGTYKYRLITDGSSVIGPKDTIVSEDLTTDSLNDDLRGWTFLLDDIARDLRSLLARRGI